MAVSQALYDVAGVDHCYDRIEPGPLRTSSSTKKVWATGRDQQACRLNEDAIEVIFPFHQSTEDADQIAAHGTADTAIVHLEHFLVGVNDEVIVDADLTEFVDDNGVFLAVLLGQDAVGASSCRRRDNQ